MKKLSKARKGRVVPGAVELTVPDVLDRLRQKLHPDHLRLSGKMRALVDFVVSERWTTPWIAGISVTSDGYVIVQPADESGRQHDEFLGSADDLYRNYAGVLRKVNATGSEARQFYDRYCERVNDPNSVRFATYIVDILSNENEFVEVPKQIVANTLIACRACKANCGQDTSGRRYGATDENGRPRYSGFCSQSCASVGRGL